MLPSFIGDAKLNLQMRVKDRLRMQSTTHGEGLTIAQLRALFQANRLSTGRGLSLAVMGAVADIGE